MQTIQDRLTLLLQKNPTIYFCQGCLALKMGAFSREVQDALVAIGLGDRLQVTTGHCSECLRATLVIRALSVPPDSINAPLHRAEAAIHSQIRGPAPSAGSRR